MSDQLARRRMTLYDRHGHSIDVPVRGTLPTSAPRVRYPGFKQERLLLKKGTVRMRGYKPLPCDIVLDRDVPIMLRDGTTIYADVFRPDDDERHPAILALSPYGKEIGGQWLDDIPGRSGVRKDQTSGLHKFEGPDPAYWCDHGYAVVNPDVRGAYSSEGVILFFGSQYGRDGADIVEWAAAQPWCNGRVGMSGNSWLAISQWFVAAEQPEHLAAIAPWEGLTDSFREVGTHGGVPTAEFVEIMSDTFASTPQGGVEDSIAAMAEHPTWDAYWEDKSVPLERIEVPAYIVGSWTNTIHTRGTFEAWQRISSKDKWLRVHTKNEWYDYYQPAHMDDLRRFFDRYLKGIENGWE
ncbi:MAG: CocE/NonD family hydrolase, partial [Coriobacteriales bacterium]